MEQIFDGEVLTEKKFREIFKEVSDSIINENWIKLKKDFILNDEGLLTKNDLKGWSKESLVSNFHIAGKIAAFLEKWSGTAPQQATSQQQDLQTAPQHKSPELILNQNKVVGLFTCSHPQINFFYYFKVNICYYPKLLKQELASLILELLHRVESFHYCILEKEANYYSNFLLSYPDYLSINDRYNILNIIIAFLSTTKETIPSFSNFAWDQVIKWEIINNKKYNLLRSEYMMIRVVQHFNNNRWIFLAKKGSEKFAIKMIYKPNENFSEYKILTSLNPHPHIIKLIDSLEISQFLVVLIFPWISKTSENLPHDPLIIKTCFKQLIEAISHCHENGFLHLDIKPSNILVELDNKEPRLYLCDFGLSVSIREAISRPFLTLAGTFSYCAPEILLEIGGDSAVDIWSAGVVLAEWIFKKKNFSWSYSR